MSSRFVNRIRTLVTTLLVSMLLAGGLVAPASAAQSQSVQSQLTGVTIGYGPQYTIMDDGVYEPNTMEMMMFLGPADILAVGFMSPLLDINSARDIILESLLGAGFGTQTIDRGDYSGVSYSLDMMNIEGIEMGTFTLFLSGRSHGYSEFYIFMAPPALFASSMQNAQNSFTIDGAQLMNGVDASVMGDMVVANQGITGGTSATDVEEVTGETNTTETTTTETTTTETATGADRDTYLAAVKAEYDAATVDFGNIIKALSDLSNDVITGPEAAEIITASSANLAGTSDRAAAIQPPAGMEAFHAEFIGWAADVTAAGNGWAATLESGNVDDFNNVFEPGLSSHVAFGELLEAELANTGGSTTETTTTTTESTTEVASGGMDRDEYLAAVQAEYDTVDSEIVAMLTALDALVDEQITVDEAFPVVTSATEVMAGTNDRIAAIQPPAGMEAFHAEFVAWADDVTTAGSAWATAVETGDAGDFNDALSVAIDTHNAFGDTLDAELAGTGSGETTGVATETSTEEATETSRTSRTSRTTSTDDTVATEEATDTSRTSRTSRTTSSGDVNATEEATETSRTSRTSRPSDSTTNTSETSGRSSSGRSSTSPSSSDRDDYLEAVRAEYDHVNDQLTIIEDTLGQMSEGTIDDDEAIRLINNANMELMDAETRIENLEAPEGMEDFHEDFLDWSDSVVGVGEAWMDFVDGRIEAGDYVDDLIALMEDTETFGDLLEDEEGASSDSSTSIVLSMHTREMIAA